MMKNPRIQALLIGFGLTALLALGSSLLAPQKAGQNPAPADEDHAASVQVKEGETEGGPGTNRQAPPINLQTFDDTPWSLAALKGEKAVLLVFWASWCSSCREEAPHINDVWQSMKGRPLAVVGINVQDKPDLARAFVKDLGLSYPMLDDPGSSVAQAYQIRALPTLILIDKAGMIRYQGHQLPPAEAIAAFL